MSSPPAKTPFPALNKRRDGYVFIITYGRSGSTLLQNVLNSIPGYCIRGENHNILPHLAMAWQAAKRTVEDRPPEERWNDPAQPWYGAEHIRYGVYGRQLANMFVGSILNPPPGTRVAGFKEIRFHAQPKQFWASIEFMAKVFPKARFIFNTRDHDAVAKSGWWKAKDKAVVVAELERAEALFTRCARIYRKRSFSLKYEDYCGNPEGLRPLYEFLGEPFDLETVTRICERKLTHLK